MICKKRNRVEKNNDGNCDFSSPAMKIFVATCDAVIYFPLLFLCSTVFLRHHKLECNMASRMTGCMTCF